MNEKNVHSCTAGEIHLKYVKEVYDENGVLSDFDLGLPENFNFAYDLIDKIAETEPDRRAVIWVDDDENERIFTYSDLKKYSDMTANMLLDHGVKKGDKVLCVLKRHYQIYFTVFALCKIGAVIIPATNQLKKKDFSYRFRKSGAKFIIATGVDGVPESIEAGLADYDGIIEKFMVHGSRDGWTDFDSEIEKYPDTLERIESNVNDDMLMFF